MIYQETGNDRGRFVQTWQPLPIAEILRRFLAIGGISCEKDPVLILWINSPAGSSRYIIKSLEEFLNTLGYTGTYQIEIEEPVISGLDVRPFRINYLSIVIPYNQETGWGEPSIHTEYEEIWGETGKIEKIIERAKKVGEKTKEVLELFRLIIELAKETGILSA